MASVTVEGYALKRETSTAAPCEIAARGIHRQRGDCSVLGRDRRSHGRCRSALADGWGARGPLRFHLCAHWRTSIEAGRPFCGRRRVGLALANALHLALAPADWFRTPQRRRKNGGKITQSSRLEKIRLRGSPGVRRQKKIDLLQAR